MTLDQLKALTVDRFDGSLQRRNLFYKLEGLVQEFLVRKIPADFWINGSFLTEEESPTDIDVAIKVMDDVMQVLTAEQDEYLARISSDDGYIDGLDIFVFAGYWIGHPSYGTEVDDGHSRVVPTYGHQFGKGRDDWLKGIAVLAVGENHVGLHLRS